MRLWTSERIFSEPLICIAFATLRRLLMRRIQAEKHEKIV